MQSLLPAVYPLLKAKYALSFFQVGLITFSFQVTASLLQPLVGPVYRSQAVGLHAVVWHNVYAAWVARLGDGQQLCRDSARRGPGRHRLFDISSGSVARGPDSHRAAATVSRNRSFQGGRQYGHSHWPTDRRVHRDATRPGQHCWLSLGAIAASALLTFVGPLVPAASRFRRATSTTRPCRRRLTPLACPGKGLDSDPARAGVFEIYLSRKSDELLHVLLDPPFQCSGHQQRSSTCLSSWAPSRPAHLAADRSAIGSDSRP